MIITIGLAEPNRLLGGSSRTARRDLGGVRENPLNLASAASGDAASRRPSAQQTPLFTPAIPAMPPRPMHPAMLPGRDPKARPMDAGHGQLFQILWAIGIVVLVIGLVLLASGSMGRVVGGRRHYY
ncbi:DUF6131 family protein [Nocardia vinacea]|uniref:DUF6131 family protein n=1 Tax=Nocardia vinacea TaxID=96468 RepID=UPI00059305F8